MALDLDAYKPADDDDLDPVPIDNAFTAIEGAVNDFDVAGLDPNGHPDGDTVTLVAGVAAWATPAGAPAVLPTGAILPYAGGGAAPAGFLKCDAAAVSRATYAALLAILKLTDAGNTTNGSKIITGLADTSKLRAGMPIEGVGIAAASTIATVDSGTQITLNNNCTANGVAVALSFFPYGNGDGTTTFNVPDGLGRSLYGASPSGKVTVATVGKSDGLAANLRSPSHHHTNVDSPTATQQTPSFNAATNQPTPGVTSGDADNVDAPAWLTVGSYIIKT